MEPEKEKEAVDKVAERLAEKFPDVSPEHIDDVVQSEYEACEDLTQESRRRATPLPSVAFGCWSFDQLLCRVMHLRCRARGHALANAFTHQRTGVESFAAYRRAGRGTPEARRRTSEMELNIKRERITDSVTKRKDLGGRKQQFTDSQILNARRLIDAGEPSSQVARDLRISWATLYGRIGALPK